MAFGLAKQREELERGARKGFFPNRFLAIPLYWQTLWGDKKLPATTKFLTLQMLHILTR